MTKPKQTPSEKLKLSLVVIFVLAIIGPGVAFYFASVALRDYATDVNNRLEDARASYDQISNLQVLKTQLAQSELLITKANSLLATADTYQAQALKDIREHASQSGITVSAIEFDEATQISGAKSIKVQLSDTVQYKQLIEFLNGIETNIPKMQVQTITIAPTDEASASQVKVSNLTINILVK